MAAAAVMALKLFLPIGEKTPDKYSQRNNAISHQGSTIILFSPLFYWILEGFLGLQAATPSSTAHLFIVILGKVKAVAAIATTNVLAEGALVTEAMSVRLPVP
jgi:hypothetical protein